MAGQRNYLRIPPDSTGKRLAIKHTSKIYYSAKDGNHSWDIDADYTLGTSGIRGVLHDWFEESPTSGYIILVLNEDDKDNDSINPITSESIVYNSTSVATVSSFHDVYYNITTVTGGHPEHELQIDYTGSANTRFAEGHPQLDAFGKLRVSNSTIIGEYVFSNDPMPTEFSSSLVGGDATLIHNHSRRCVELQLTEDSNSYTTLGITHQGLISHTSNTYHHYTPGLSQLYMATVMLGDTGQQNLIRTWGLHDYADGFMFMQKDGVLGVAVRNSVTAAEFEEIFIPQSQWNGDKLDGTGSSKQNLDVTKDNIYWIDYQWLGAGTIRFGVNIDGTRITCHSHHNANKSNTSSTSTGSLPVCQAQYATGQITGTVSMFIWCIGIYSEGNIKIKEQGRNDVSGFIKTITNPADQYYYIGTLSPKLLDYNNLHYNHSLYFPDSLDVISLDTNGNGVPGVLEVYIEPVLSGLSFESIAGSGSYSTVQKDVSATYYGGGSHQMIEFVGKDGFRTVDLNSRYNSLTSGAFKNYSCQGGVKSNTISNITNTSPAIITISDSEWSLREVIHFPYNLRNVAGMTEINSDEVYLKITGLNTAELYTDVSRTIPLDTTGYGSFINDTNGEIYGFRGSQMFFSLVWKPFVTTADHTVRVKLHWKEVIQ